MTTTEPACGKTPTVLNEGAIRPDGHRSRLASGPGYCVVIALAGGALSLWNVRGVMALGASCAGIAAFAFWRWARREAASMAVAPPPVQVEAV